MHQERCPKQIYIEHFEDNPMFAIAEKIQHRRLNYGRKQLFSILNAIKIQKKRIQFHLGYG